MKLITVEAAFAPSNLDMAISLFTEQANVVRAMPGCKHYALYRKIAGDGIAILQQWESMTAFDAYRASEAFADLGQGLRPLMTSPPVTIIAEVGTV